MAVVKSYYKDGDKKKYWRAIAYLGYKDGKKQMQKKQGFLREKDAKAWALDLEEKAKKGYVTSKYKDMLLKDFIMEWFNDHKKDTLSINAQGNNLSRINTHIIPELGNYKLNDIETYQVQKFYNDMINKKGLNPDSAKKVMETLNNCFKYAKKNKLISDIPSDIEKKPSTRSKASFWTKAESNYYLKQITGHYLYTPVLIALNTGLRVAEICGLRWSDIDLDKKILSVTHQVVQDKTTKQLIFSDELKTPTSYRKMTIPNILVNHLKALKSEIRPKNNHFIVTDREGNMCNPRNLSMNFTGNIEKYRYPVEAYRSAIKNYTNFKESSSHNLKYNNNFNGQIKRYVCKRGGYKNRIKDYMQLKQITFHDLRHTHATLLIFAGENIKVVSERLGHSNVKVTLDTYFHVIEEMKVNTSNLLDDMFT